MTTAASSFLFVWVTVGKTQHHALLVKEEGDHRKLIKWSSTGGEEWIDTRVNDVATELSPRRRSRKRTTANATTTSNSSEEAPKKKKQRRAKKKPSTKENEEEESKVNVDSSNADTSNDRPLEEESQQERPEAKTEPSEEQNGHETKENPVVQSTSRHTLEETFEDVPTVATKNASTVTSTSNNDNENENENRQSSQPTETVASPVSTIRTACNTHKRETYESDDARNNNFDQKHDNCSNEPRTNVKLTPKPTASASNCIQPTRITPGSVISIPDDDDDDDNSDNELEIIRTSSHHIKNGRSQLKRPPIYAMKQREPSPTPLRKPTPPASLRTARAPITKKSNRICDGFFKTTTGWHGPITPPVASRSISSSMGKINQIASTENKKSLKDVYNVYYQEARCFLDNLMDNPKSANAKANTKNTQAQKITESELNAVNPKPSQDGKLKNLYVSIILC